MLLAKVKDNTLIKYPYGFDDLQEDNPNTRFTGTIDLMNIFKDTEQCVLHGYELVEVEIEQEPELMTFHVAVLSDIPVKENNKWILKWNVEFVPPDINNQNN